MKTVLVTGVNGFVGQHLARELYSREHRIVGLGHNEPASEQIKDLLTDYLNCDLADEEQVSKLEIDNIDAVISLAGLAQVGASFDQPEKYKRINVAVLTNLANRFVEANQAARFVAVSSGAVYDPGQSLPLTEESRLVADGSPYAASKILMEQAAHDYRAQGSLDCVVVRPFNHAGPGQREGFLIPDLYEKINRSKDTREPLQVGNLHSRRDYTDVRDVVKAYTDLLEPEELTHPTYNVCSGTSRPGQEILDLMLNATRLNSQVEVEVDQSLIRPHDPPNLYGSYDKLQQQTGWSPSIPFEQTVRDFVAAH